MQIAMWIAVAAGGVLAVGAMLIGALTWFLAYSD